MLINLFKLILFILFFSVIFSIIRMLLFVRTNVRNSRNAYSPKNKETAKNEPGTIELDKDQYKVE